MSTITLKDVPPDIHEALTAQARVHGRSLNKEIIAILSGAIHGYRLNAEDILRRARAVRETMDVYVTPADLTTLKNAGRK
jgi:plasmid stability protein